MRRALAFLAIPVALAAAGLPPRVRVERPRVGVPALVAPGDPLLIEMRTSLPWIAPSFEARLAGEGGEADLTLAREGFRGSRLSLRGPVPPLPDGGYALEVRTGGEVQRFPGAVWIRREWPRRFSFVQIADLPYRSAPGELRQFVTEMNLTRPAFVLATGDLAYGGAEEWYRLVWEQFESLDVPLIAVPGNHEREGWSHYLDRSGPLRHRVDAGPLAILSLDSGHGRDALTPSAFRWLVEQLADLGGRTPIVQIHHPLFPPGKAKKGEAGGSGGFLHGYHDHLIDLLAERGVPLVLSGHWHADGIFDSLGTFRGDRPDFPGTHYAVVTALGADLREVTFWSKLYHGYRRVEIADGRVVRETYDLDGSGRPSPIASVPLGKLRPSEIEPGMLEVVNDLNEGFEEAFASLWLPARREVCIGGTIRGVHPERGGFRHDVSFPLPARSRARIRLEAP